ncbi:hypothetical protein CC79DRAFT_1338499 [Sarocladium strictum]
MGHSSRRFTLSPAVKASHRVLDNPNRSHSNRTSVDSHHSTHTLGETPVVQVQKWSVDPIQRWTSCNRI